MLTRHGTALAGALSALAALMLMFVSLNRYHVGMAFAAASAADSTLGYELSSHHYSGAYAILIGAVGFGTVAVILLAVYLVRRPGTRMEPRGATNTGSPSRPQPRACQRRK
ncbi:MAG: hypothetical protein LBH13_02250 [Cellulomonadaceae bacterium]|nr:hypothetical protein [Cellulomonadaceae bacterium]